MLRIYNRSGRKFKKLCKEIIGEWRRLCVNKVEQLIVERNESEKTLSLIISYGGKESFWYASTNCAIALYNFKIEVLKAFHGRKYNE